MADDIVLRTLNLGKKFGRRWAVQDLNLSVPRGKVFGFLGPNGAGKSTTIRMILSLVAPTTGSVELFGTPLRGNRSAILRQVGGLVESADFYLYLSARRNLEVIAGLTTGLPARAIDEVLESVGLASRADEKVRSYSHGMKQRLGIACALLGSPQFVVLDEPTAGLDPQGIRDVRTLVTSLARERNITVFLSSHLLAEIEQVASSMAIIDKGILLAQGTVSELLLGRKGELRITATPVARALEIARGFPWAHDVSLHGTELHVTIDAEHISALNDELVRSGVAVSALIPQRSLEEYFLSLTDGRAGVS